MIATMYKGKVTMGRTLEEAISRHGITETQGPALGQLNTRPASSGVASHYATLLGSRSLSTRVTS